MKAMFGGGGVPTHLRDVPEPRITDGRAAIVHPLAVAVCDLDVVYLLDLLPTGQPYAFGHEFTAQVIEVGSDVTTLRPGDVVSVPFQISCGGCSPCRRSLSLHCASVPPISTYGLEPFGGGSAWGGVCTDLALVPFADAMCLTTPSGANPIGLASVSDNVVDGYRSLVPHLRPGDEGLVLGSASVGLYAVACARAVGAPVTYVDDDHARLAVAERLGAVVIESPIDGRSFGQYPVVALCSSLPEAFESAIASTAPGGVCQSSGIFYFGINELDLVDVYKRGIVVHTGRANARDDMPSVLSLVEQGRLDLDAVIGNVVPFSQAPGGLEHVLTHKTVIDMTV